MTHEERYYTEYAKEAMRRADDLDRRATKLAQSLTANPMLNGAWEWELVSHWRETAADTREFFAGLRRATKCQ